MVSCGGAAAIPGRQRSMGKISGFDVVDGSVRIYVRSMVGEPGRGLSGATTSIGRRRRPGMGMVGGRAVWAAQVVTFDMSGLVWCKPGSWRAFRDAQVCCGWAGGQRRLSRSCHKRRETWWDGSRCAETISADQREGREGLGRVTHGFSLTGGQVVAGSNTVSPTKSRQVKCYFYLLPKLTPREHLIRSQRRPGIAAP